MNNCTVVNYSIKGELVNMTNSTNDLYQPGTAEETAKQASTHKESNMNTCCGCKMQEPPCCGKDGEGVEVEGWVWAQTAAQWHRWRVRVLVTLISFFCSDRPALYRWTTGS